MSITPLVYPINRLDAACCALPFTVYSDCWGIGCIESCSRRGCTCRLPRTVTAATNITTAAAIVASVTVRCGERVWFRGEDGIGLRCGRLHRRRSSEWRAAKCSHSGLQVRAMAADSWPAGRGLVTPSGLSGSLPLNHLCGCVRIHSGTCRGPATSAHRIYA